MQTFFAYGLNVAAELPLLDCVASNQSPDVTVSFGPLDRVHPEPHSSQEMLVQLPWGLKFLICHGSTIIIDCPPELPLPIVRAHVLGTGMAFLLRQRGYLVLHASCVAKDNRAIAFMGASGWGKSTLASMFHQQGYRLITDDVMAIQMGATPQVVPSFPEVRLLPDAVAALQEKPSDNLGPKQIQCLDDLFSNQPATLQRLYVLRLGEQKQIEPLAKAQSFMELIQHSRAIKTLNDPRVQVQHFHQCSNLAKVVPMGYLKRPRSLEQLPQVVQMIEDDLCLLRTGQAS